MNDQESNQNSLVICNDDDNSLTAIRAVFSELKELYNEFLLQVRLIQKDLIRASKYDELESKVIFFNQFII